MANYRVNNNPQKNGDHEVHKQGCTHYTVLTNYQALGDHPDCHSAVNTAKLKLHHKQVNGCFFCSPLCHTQ